MKTFNIDNNNINIGANKIIITKNYHFLNPSFFLSTNNIKTQIKDIEILNNKYIVNFYINKKSNIKIIIKDGIIEESETLHFFIEHIEQFDINNLIIQHHYNKDKIFLNIKNINSNNIDLTLKFEGDINKIIIWKKELKELNISFPYKINGFANITYKLNNILKKSTIYNLDDFPKNIIKIKNGLKFNKICDFDLLLKSEHREIIIKKGTLLINLFLNKDETFEVYINDFLLFKQKITAINHLPHLTILNNPLRIKLSQTFYEDISIKFKNKKEVWIIKQGLNEIYLPYKGICKLTLESVNNAVYDISSWIYHIK